MFNKSATPPASVTSAEYLWADTNNDRQSIWISVQDWQYKVFPSRQAKAFGSFLFQFEGEVTTESLKGLTIAGTIEVLEEGETPTWLDDVWKQVPKDVEGHVSLTGSVDPTRPPNIDVTLYCQESALDWIFRAFSVASQGRSGGLGIEVKVDCPNNEGGPFWAEQWRREYLRVVSWELFAGSKI